MVLRDNEEEQEEEDDEKEEDKLPAESEEDYADAVTRHAKYLGIDPEIDAAYVWIAEEVSTRGI